MSETVENAANEGTRTVIGRVVSNRMDKTASVAVERSRNQVEMGAATNSDEKVPTMSPINSASANSWRVTAPMTNEPTTRTDSTGRMDVIEVLIDRISTWFSDRSMSSVALSFAFDMRYSLSRTLSNTTIVS